MWAYTGLCKCILVYRGYIRVCRVTLGYVGVGLPGPDLTKKTCSRNSGLLYKELQWLSRGMYRA